MNKLPKEVSDYFASLGRKSRENWKKNTTPEERSEGARNAAKARWAKRNKTVDNSA